MLMGDSKMNQNEKENVLAKVDLENDKEILIEMKRKMKAIKAVEEDKDITNVLFTGNRDHQRGRSRERRQYREDWKDRSRSNKNRYGFRSNQRYDSRIRS